MSESTTIDPVLTRRTATTGGATDTPLRVLHFISRLSMGGAVKGAIELVHALEQIDGIEARLCAIESSDSTIDASSLRNPPIQLHCPLKSRLHTFRRWRRIRRLVREFRPDIVHSHLWPTSREVAWATAGMNLPHVVHIRDTPPNFAENRWQSQIKNRWLRFSLNSSRTHFIAVSDAARNYAMRHLQLRESQVSTVVNGIDLSPFVDIPPPERRAAAHRVTIGTAARLVPSKGIGDLIDAVAQLVAQGRDVDLRIAGEGSERPRLEELCRRLGIADRVAFLGNVESMPRFLAAIDVFALASHSAEGLPRVLLEAMAAGVPVVTTDCEGVESIAGLKEHGVIIPTRDAAALARGMEQFIASVEQRRVRGAESREAVREHHSIERVCEQVLQEYQRLRPGHEIRKMSVTKC